MQARWSWRDASCRLQARWIGAPPPRVRIAIWSVRNGSDRNTSRTSGRASAIRVFDVPRGRRTHRKLVLTADDEYECSSTADRRENLGPFNVGADAFMMSNRSSPVARRRTSKTRTGPAPYSPYWNLPRQGRADNTPGAHRASRTAGRRSMVSAHDMEPLIAGRWTVRLGPIDGAGLSGSENASGDSPGARNYRISPASALRGESQWAQSAPVHPTFPCSTPLMT